jgi:hypothetical protein
MLTFIFHCVHYLHYKESDNDSDFPGIFTPKASYISDDEQHHESALAAKIRGKGTLSALAKMKVGKKKKLSKTSQIWERAITSPVASPPVEKRSLRVKFFVDDDEKVRMVGFEGIIKGSGLKLLTDKYTGRYMRWFARLENVPDSLRHLFNLSNSIEGASICFVTQLDMKERTVKEFKDFIKEATTLKATKFVNKQITNDDILEICEYVNCHQPNFLK